MSEIQSSFVVIPQRRRRTAPAGIHREALRGAEPKAAPSSDHTPTSKRPPARNHKNPTMISAAGESEVSGTLLGSHHPNPTDNGQEIEPYHAGREDSSQGRTLETSLVVSALSTGERE
jgi:hypothetical protein